MNKITFTGHLGHDAEVKTLPSGQEITEFDVAVTIGWGENKHTEWRGCSVWGERGTKLAQYLRKGTAVAVAGTPTCEFWTNKKTGEATGKIAVRVDDVTLLGGQEAEKKPIESFDSRPRTSTHQDIRHSAFVLDNKEDGDDVPF